MDRERLVLELQKAEEHVRQGESHLKSQRRVIAELKKDGHDTKTARSLYRTFEDLQLSHVANRDRLALELRHVDDHAARIGLQKDVPLASLPSADPSLKLHP